MEEIKINRQTQLTALTAFIASVAALRTTVREANAKAIEGKVSYAANDTDASIVSGVSDEVTLQDTSHLDDAVAEAQDWVNLLGVHTGETLEVDEHEARKIAETLATPVVAESVKRKFRISAV